MKAVWAAAVAVLAATPGCKKHASPEHAPATAPDDAAAAATAPERVVVVNVPVRLEPQEGDPAAWRASEKALGKQLRSLLVGTGAFVGGDDEVPAGMHGRRARVEVSISYALGPAPSGKGRDAHALIQARLIWRDGGQDLAPSDNLDLVRTLPQGEDPSRALVEQIAAALPLAARGLADKERIRAGSVDDVRAALAATTADGAADDDLRIWAMQVARERQLSALTDDVIALLRDPSRSVRSAAIGALQALGQRRAVKPIADATDMSDPQFVRLAIDAAAALGGDEARDFLEFLADGHPDADIRNDARRALVRMAARGGDDDAQASPPRPGSPGARR